jgi:hypothetical protein
MHIHHTGYIVSNSEDTSVLDGELNLLRSAVDPLQDAKISLYKNHQNEQIELIQPLSEKSPVWNFLQKGGGFHHTCYAGSQLELDQYIAAHSLTKIMGPVPAVIFDSRDVLFYLNKNKEIIEFFLEN